MSLRIATNTVEASSAGVLKTQPIDTTAPVPALGFSFP